MNQRISSSALTIRGGIVSTRTALASGCLFSVFTRIPPDSLGNPIELADTTAVDSAALDNKNPEYYLQQLPVTEEQIAESNDIIKDGLFNLGKIYKDKLEDYGNAEKNARKQLKNYRDISKPKYPGMS